MTAAGMRVHGWLRSGEAAANVLLRACGCGRVTATSGDAADSSLQGGGQRSVATVARVQL